MGRGKAHRRIIPRASCPSTSMFLLHRDSLFLLRHDVAVRDQLDPGYCQIIDKFFLMGKTEVSSVPMYVCFNGTGKRKRPSPHSHIFLTSSNFIMFLESRKELISTWELVLKATNNKDKTKREEICNTHTSYDRPSNFLQWASAETGIDSVARTYYPLQASAGVPV